MSLLGIVRRHRGAAVGPANQPLQEKLALDLRCAMAAIPPYGLNLPIQAFLPGVQKYEPNHLFEL